MSKTRSLIEFHNISFIYNKKDPNRYDAIKNINFTLEKGAFVALVGKTGSGKSTLVQTLNALLLPNEGYTRVEDFYITQNKELKKTLKKEHNLKGKDFKNYSNLRKEVGIVFQFPEYQLFSDSVLKDVMFGPKNFGMKEEEAKEAAINALNSVGIDKSYYKRSPFELSGGEKRRVAIAGIIASNPSILILDEPTVGLDPNGKEEILNLIKKIHESGKTIIVVTHDMDLVMNYAQKVVVLKDSKYIGMKTPKELFNSKDLTDYSLEIPTFYKFKKLLKNNELFKDDKSLENIDDLDSLTDYLLSFKKEKTN